MGGTWVGGRINGSFGGIPPRPPWHLTWLCCTLRIKLLISSYLDLFIKYTDYIMPLNYVPVGICTHYKNAKLLVLKSLTMTARNTNTAVTSTANTSEARCIDLTVLLIYFYQKQDFNIKDIVFTCTNKFYTILIFIGLDYDRNTALTKSLGALPWFCKNTRNLLVL